MPDRLLFRCEELLAYRLATIHNLTFMHHLMRQIREAIAAGSFNSFKDSYLAGYKTTDEALRISQKQKWLDRQNSGESNGSPA